MPGLDLGLTRSASDQSLNFIKLPDGATKHICPRVKPGPAAKSIVRPMPAFVGSRLSFWARRVKPLQWPGAHSLQAHRREPSAFQPGDCSGQYRRCSQGRYGWGRRARRSSSSVVTRHLPLVIDLDDPVPAGRLRKSPNENTPGTISLPTRALKLGPVKPGVVGSDCPLRNREDFSPTQSCRLIRRRRSDFGIGVRRMTTANQQSQGCD
jgi:hypothetical protein